MLIRQKVILSLIDQMDGQMPDGTQGKVSRLQLVKWAFLFREETKIKTFYQFIPYYYGPFSFTLYHELETLKRKGYIRFSSSEDGIQRISDVATPPIASTLGNEIKDFSGKYRSLSTKELIDHVYSHYPWFTIHAKQLEQQREKRPIGKCAVYTAGYEGLHIDGFLNILLKAGIQQVIDVRCNPVSRRYGFHKSTLSKLCQGLDIQYRHVPEVGIPSEARANLRQPSDYIKLFQNYRKEVLDVQQDVVKGISGWVASRHLSWCVWRPIRVSVTGLILQSKLQIIQSLQLFIYGEKHANCLYQNQNSHYRYDVSTSITGISRISLHSRSY